jgi:hypothetical protein
MLWVLLAGRLCAQAPEYAVERLVFGSPLRLSASRRTAGAVSSITWRGREFLDAYDHGRELQSALSVDGLGECYNPTEAGSERDGTGPRSSSRLIRYLVTGNVLETEAEMAFWLAPGQKYPGGCGGRQEFFAAQNTEVRGGYRVRKRVTVGIGNLPNAIEYAAEFTIPRAHESATYEFATAYLPPEFSAFFTYDPATQRVAPLSDGPGEQTLPVILATPDRSFAMGVWSPDPAARYGRFKFLDKPGTPGWNTVKWNCVFRAMDVAPGVYRNRCFVVVGTVDEVARTLGALSNAKE